MHQWISGCSKWKWSAIALILWLTGCKQPEAPEYYGFQNLQVSQIVAGQTSLSAIVKLYNPNPFSLELKHADVDVSVNGKHIGHSTLDSTIVIPRRDTFYVPVALQVDIKAILSNVMQTLLSRQATIGLDGHVKISHGMLTFRRPFHYEGKQDLNSLLQSGMGL